MCRLSENDMNPELCTSGSWMKHPHLWRAFSVCNSLCCDSAWIWKWASKSKVVLTWHSVRWKYRIGRSHCWSQQQLSSNLSLNEHISLEVLTGNIPEVKMVRGRQLRSYGTIKQMRGENPSQQAHKQKPSGVS